VIKGENYHVLEALQFTHAGKIDCIYIDPPYVSSQVPIARSARSVHH
jgi:16S rRNA G966 N2-methylase RsmD